MKLPQHITAWALGLVALACASTAGAQQGQLQNTMQVEAVMQPLSAPQEFVRTKSMQAGLAVTPVRIELGEWRGLKAVQEDRVDGGTVARDRRNPIGSGCCFADAVAALCIGRRSGSYQYSIKRG